MAEAKPDIEGGEFKSFILQILGAAMAPEITEMMVAEPALENYFRRAFTHKTFALNRPLGKAPKFDYEVIEKIGDGVLKASFQLWLFEILGDEVTTPQIYSDIEKRMTGTDYLSFLAETLKFSRWIQVTEGSLVTNKIKEDVFESFVAAIVLAGDKFVMKDMGFCLAKRWIYQVYNTYGRDKINPRDPRSYTDFRSQVNDIWQFHGWGTPKYRDNATGSSSRAVGAQAVVESDLIGPNKPNFPEVFRGRVLGSGVGFASDASREEASRKALETIGANYPELRGFEIQLATGDPKRFGEVVSANPTLLADVVKTMESLQNVYQAVAIRKLRVYGTYGVQLRVQEGGIWRSSVRTKSEESYDDAVLKAFKAFVDNFHKRGSVVFDKTKSGPGAPVPVAFAQPSSQQTIPIGKSIAAPRTAIPGATAQFPANPSGRGTPGRRPPSRKI